MLGKEINDDGDNNRDGRDDNIIEKDEVEDNNVPFILPFNAVPFP